MLRKNPGIMTAFKAGIEAQAELENKKVGTKEVQLQDEYATYEAVAIEWFLIGLIEPKPSELG